MAEPRKCLRGHTVTGGNAITSKGRASARCRACKRATDRVRNNPELKGRMQEMSDEAYRDIQEHGSRDMPGPRPKATKAAPKAARKRTRKRAPKAPVAPKGDVDVREVERLMPNGAKRWLLRALEEQLQPNDIPASMHPWFKDYDLIRPSYRTGALIFSERARKIMRQLQARFAGQN